MIDAYDITDKLKDVLKSEGRIEEVSEEFRDMCYDENNDYCSLVRFVEKLLKDRNLMISKWKKEERCDEKANNFRIEGNNFYQRKNFLKALENYNKSICYSTKGSENIGTIFANRSAVYLELELYDKSVLCIDQAIRHGYKNVDKLRQRKQKCLEKIRKNPDDLKLMHEPIGHDFFKLSHPANPKIPFIADCLELKTEDKFGRYVITNKRLKPGEIIAIEEPFSKCLLRGENYKYCCNCLDDNCLFLIPCPNCTQAMFCSENCLREGTYKFHRFECGLMEILDKVCTKIMRVSMRTFLEGFSLFRFDPLMFSNFYGECRDENNKTVFDFDFTSEDMKAQRTLESMKRLVTLVAQRSTADIFQRCGIVSILVHLFLNYSPLKDILKCARSQDFFRQFIFFNTQQAALNYHGIFDGIMTRSQSSICPQYGSGGYPFCSLINHSCAPNIVRISFRCKNYLMVNRPIEEGGQLFDNYGYHHCLEDVAHRRAQLKNQYLFDCRCEACINNYPLFQDLDVKDENFEAFIKDDVAKLTAMDVETAKNRFKEYCDYLNTADHRYPSYEISCLQECMLRSTFILKMTPFKLKLLERD